MEGGGVEKRGSQKLFEISLLQAAGCETRLFAFLTQKTRGLNYMVLTISSTSKTPVTLGDKMQVRLLLLNRNKFKQAIKDILPKMTEIT